MCQARAVWTGAWGPGLRGCGQMRGAHGCFMDHESATCSVRWSHQLAGHFCEFPSQVPLCGRPTGWFLFCWNVTRPSLDSQTGLHGALCAQVPSSCPVTSVFFMVPKDSLLRLCFQFLPYPLPGSPCLSFRPLGPCPQPLGPVRTASPPLPCLLAVVVLPLISS